MFVSLLPQSRSEQVCERIILWESKTEYLTSISHHQQKMVIGAVGISEVQQQMINTSHCTIIYTLIYAFRLCVIFANDQQVLDHDMDWGSDLKIWTTFECVNAH